MQGSGRLASQDDPLEFAPAGQGFAVGMSAKRKGVLIRHSVRRIVREIAPRWMDRRMSGAIWFNVKQSVKPGRNHTVKDPAQEALRSAALEYHSQPRPGKLEVRATKPLANGRDLARAYSPGVAEASKEIHADPSTARDYTARGNLVAVVSNGSAVLGLGNIGALASKPVMEGKAVLFKKFANIDCFDIEVDEADPEKLAGIICALEPTFGAINLEDIKAPDCFIVERLCRERMNIPVFHDDQHGTAIVVGLSLIHI